MLVHSAAHPNVRLFITHGGLLSKQESVHRGVPVVGIPIYGDQALNMARVVSAGLGVLLQFTNVTTESVLWAVQEVLENPRYSMFLRIVFEMTLICFTCILP
jgi:glucuronosyltransferase